MKRKIISAFFCILLLVCYSSIAFAADDVEPAGPIYPVELSNEDSSESITYFGNPDIRVPLSYGTLTIKHGGTLIATGTGATYATQTCPLIKFFIRLYKYNPSDGSSSYVDYKNFYAADAVFCAGAHNFTVPSAGYYYLIGIHTIADETKNTQTSAIYIN